MQRQQVGEQGEAQGRGSQVPKQTDLAGPGRLARPGRPRSRRVGPARSSRGRSWRSAWPGRPRSRHRQSRCPARPGRPLRPQWPRPGRPAQPGRCDRSGLGLAPGSTGRARSRRLGSSPAWPLRLQWLRLGVPSRCDSSGLGLGAQLGPDACPAIGVQLSPAARSRGRRSPRDRTAVSPGVQLGRTARARAAIDVQLGPAAKLAPYATRGRPTPTAAGADRLPKRPTSQRPGARPPHGLIGGDVT